MPRTDTFEKVYNELANTGLEVSPGIFYNNLHNPKFFNIVYDELVKTGLTIPKDRFKEGMGIGDEVQYMYNKEGQKVTPEQFFNKTAPTTDKAPVFQSPNNISSNFGAQAINTPIPSKVKTVTPPKTGINAITDLSKFDNLPKKQDGSTFRLPTAQEWENISNEMPRQQWQEISDDVRISTDAYWQDVNNFLVDKDPPKDEYTIEQHKDNPYEKYKWEKSQLENNLNQINAAIAYNERQLNIQRESWDNKPQKDIDILDEMSSEYKIIEAQKTDYEQYQQVQLNKLKELQQEAQALSTNDPAKYEAELSRINAEAKVIQDEMNNKIEQINKSQIQFQDKYNNPIIDNILKLKQKQSELSTKAFQLIEKPEYTDIKAQQERFITEQKKSDISEQIREKYINGELTPEEINKYREDGTLQNHNAQAWLARTTGKFLSDILSLPRTGTGLFEGNYGWADKLAEWANRVNDNLVGNNPYSSNLNVKGIQETVQIGDFKVLLDDGIAVDVRDKNNFAVSYEKRKQILNTYDESPDKYPASKEFNTNVMMKNALNTITDMGIMIAGSKGTGTILKAGTTGQKFITASAIFGQTHNDIYKQGIEAGLNPKDAARYATMVSTSVALVSYLNPMEYKLAGGSGNGIMSKILNASALSADDVALANTGKLTGFELAKKYTTGVIKNVVGENIEEQFLEPLAQDAISTLYEKQGNFEQQYNPSLEETALVSLTTLPFGFAEVNSEMPTYHQEALMRTAENPEKYLELMQEKLTKGLISQQQFDSDVQNMQIIISTFNSISPDIDKNLREQLIGLIGKKQIIVNKIKQINDDVLSQKWKQSLEKVNADIKNIIDGKQPTNNFVEIPEQQPEEAVVVDPPNQDVKTDNEYKAFDFDGTLFDNKTGELTELGQQVKQRIAEGEDIKIITARDNESIKQIEDLLGISSDNIYATGEESKKKETLTSLGLSTDEYYDADAEKLNNIRNKSTDLATVGKEDLTVEKETIQNLPPQEKERQKRIEALSGIKELLPVDVETSSRENLDNSEGTTQPQEKDTVKLPPIREGGMERNMVFSDGKWQMKVGSELTNVSEQVQKEANNTFINEQNLQQSEGIDSSSEPISIQEMVEPSQEQQLMDIKNGNVVTFDYETESEVPEVFKGKISSKGKVNGKSFIKVTIPKSLADYHLAKITTQKKNKQSNKSASLQSEAEQNPNRLKTIPKERFQKLLSILQKAFPNVVLFYDKETLKEQLKKYNYNNIQFFRTKNGTIYGAKFPDGSIYLNPETLNANTPIHEFAHIWQQMFPAEFKRGITILKASLKGRELIKKIALNPAYSTDSKEAIEAEALVTAIGDMGEIIFNDNKSLLAKFKEWVKDLFTKISDALNKATNGKLGTAITPDMLLDEFAKKVVGELLGGKELKGESQAKISNKKGSFSEDTDNINFQFEPNNPTHVQLSAMLNNYIAVCKEVGDVPTKEEIKEILGEQTYDKLISELGEEFIDNKINPPKTGDIDLSNQQKGEKRDKALIQRAELTFGKEAEDELNEIGRKYTSDNWKEIEPRVEAYAKKVYASPKFAEEVENIINWIKNTTSGEYTEKKGLATAQTMLLNKLIMYSYNTDKESFKKLLAFSADRAKVFGQAIAAYSEASTPENLFNRAVVQIEGEKEVILDTIQPNGQTLRDMLLETLSKLTATAEQIDKAITSVENKGSTKQITQPKPKSTRPSPELVSKSKQIKEQARKKIDNAKNRLAEWLEKNATLGFAYDPKKEAEKTKELVSIVKDLILGYFEYGFANIKDAINKRLGDKINIDDIWGLAYDEDVQNAEREQQKEKLVSKILSTIKDPTTAKQKDVTTIIANALANKARKLSNKPKNRSAIANDVKALLQNEELAKEAWTEAMNKAIDAVNNDNALTLQQKMDKISIIEDAIANFTVVPSSISRKAIRDGLKDLNTSIKEIATEHYTKADDTKKTLIEKLISQLGISVDEATSYSEALAKEFDMMLSEKRKDILDNLLTNKKKPNRKQKTENRKILEAINAGALSGDDFINMFASKFGFNAITAEQANKLQTFIELINTANGEIKRQLAKEMGDYIDSLKSLDARGFSRLLQNVMVHHALSGLKTTFENIPIGSTLSTMFNLLPVIAKNPIVTMKFIKSYSNAGLNGTGIKAFASTMKTGYNDMDFFLAEEDIMKKGSRYYNFLNNIGWDNPTDAVMNLYKIPLHIAYFASAFDNIVNHRGGELLNFIEEYNIANKESGDVMTKVLNRMGYDKAETYAKQVDNEIEDMKDNNIKVPIGYKERRVKELMIEGRNKEIQQQAYETIKQFGLMGTPNSFYFSPIYHKIKQFGTIDEKSNAVLARFLFSITLGMFLRISVASAEMILNSMPILGIAFSAMKYDIKQPQGSKKRFATKEEFKKAAMLNVMTTSMALMAFAEMFDIDDDEIKLNPDRRIDISGYSVDFFESEQVRTNGESQKPMSIRFKNKDGSWSKWYEGGRFIPPLVSIFAIAGKMRDNLLIRETKDINLSGRNGGKKGELKEGEGIVKVSDLKNGLWWTLAGLQVASYNSIANFGGKVSDIVSYSNNNEQIEREKKIKDAKKLLFTTFFSRPTKTILEPNLFRDFVRTGESLTDATKTMDNIYRNSIREFYGIDHLLNHKQLDIFGNEVKQPFLFFDKEERYNNPEWKLFEDKNIVFDTPYIAKTATFDGEKHNLTNEQVLILNDKVSILFGNKVRENIEELKGMNQAELLLELNEYKNDVLKEIKDKPLQEALK